MNRKTKEQVLEEFRVESIQDAAMRVIAKKGIDDSTIQDIADEAGIAKGTVYLYFRDREELFAKTADCAFEKLVVELGPAFDAPGTFGDRLHGLVTRQLQFFDDNRALYRATMALSQRDGDLHKRRSVCFAQYATRLEQMFADAAKAGAMRDLDPHAVAAVYRDCIRGVVVRRLDPKSQKSRGSIQEDAELIVSILLRGIQSGEK